MIKMGYVKPIDAHSKKKGVISRKGRLLTNYHTKFKKLETKHLMHKDNKGDLADLIDQYRQAMELLQAVTKAEQPESPECSNIDNHAGYMHIDLEKCKVCGDKWVKPDAEGYAKYLADIERDYKEFSTVEEPKKPKKQTYEMWKVWYTIGELLETYIFLDEKVARRRAVELSSEYR